jgi:hypothetical protein
MRRLILPLLLVSALAGTAQAAPAGVALKVKADWFASSHALFVRTSWSPSASSTDVHATVSVDGRTLRTLTARHWLIGTKTFEFDLPARLRHGAALLVAVSASSPAGAQTRTVALRAA